MQPVVYDCFAQMDLDAIVYPSGNIPPGILTSPPEPTVNDRGLNWTTNSSRGFAALTVPAGFTTKVYDRGLDGTLLPAIPAALRLASTSSVSRSRSRRCSREAATNNRRPPAAFPPL